MYTMYGKLYKYTLSIYSGEPLSTVGVDLGIWKYRKDLEKRMIRSVKTMRSVTFYTWDFGGQVSHYSTDAIPLCVTYLK